MEADRDTWTSEIPPPPRLPGSAPKLGMSTVAMLVVCAVFCSFAGAFVARIGWLLAGLWIGEPNP